MIGLMDVWKVIRSRGMPLILLLVEINLTIILARNMQFFYEMTTYIYGDYLVVAYSVCSIVTLIITSLLTIRTMLSLPSANKRSWRSTQRTLFILILMSIFYTMVLSKFYVVDVRLVILLTILDMAILFLPSVRRYYTPPLTEMPSAKEWLYYAFLSPEDTITGYKFVYKDGDEKN